MEVNDMNKNKKVCITAVAVITSTLLTISSAFAGDYYPEGPQLNVAVDTVQSGGWELCFEDSFANDTALVQTMLNNCPGEYIMLAGKYNDQANIAVLAAGERSAVFQVQTVYNQKTLSNGTYFYLFPNVIYENNNCDFNDEECFFGNRSHSMGFSLSEETDIHTCDYIPEEGPRPSQEYRLCRHIQGDGLFTQGWLIGTSDGVGSAAKFQVYQMNSLGTPSNTALLAQAERQKQDTFILAAATLAIASVSNSLSQLTASLLPKTVCVKKGKKSKSVGALQACPKGYTAKK